MNCEPCILYPTKVINKNKVLHIPKGELWEKAGDFYIPVNYGGLISCNLAMASDCFKTISIFTKITTKNIENTEIEEDIQKEKLPKTNWIPQEGEDIWMVGINGQLVKSKYYNAAHESILNFGNIFPSSKEALVMLNKIKKIFNED